MKYKVMDGNEACAHISYMFSDAASIYPITPASTMAENIDVWSNNGRTNLFNSKVKVVEMQSEAGAIGTIHGLLQTGLIGSTYTASQGLLLMIPEMYKIAGELLPSVINVAARTISTHALSIFGDHSDIYAARSTGYSFISSSSVQDVMYMTLVSYLSTFKGKVPVVNFFDGFRTSHELSKINVLEKDDIIDLVDYDLINEFRKNSSLAKKQIKGTTQNDDVYFQNVEARNKYYDEFPDIVNEYMSKINDKFRTNYHPFDYYGAKDADKVIIAMGSVCETIKEVIEEKGEEEKLGLIVVRLFRPFSSKYLLKVLPKSTKKIAVLDRAKEMTSKEALYLDVVDSFKNKDITVIGGRYGLSSKNTTPSDIYAVYKNLDNEKKEDFTIGIVDDVTNKSLEKEEIKLKNKNIEMLIYGYGSDGMVSASKDIIKLVGDNTNGFVQGYNQYDSKKSGGVTISHLRIGKEPIKSSYYVENPHIVVCSKDSYLDNYDILKSIRKNGIFILNTSKSIDEISNRIKKIVSEKELRFYIIDANKIARENNIPNKISTIMENAIFKITKILPYDIAKEKMKESINKKFSKKGEEIVNNNLNAIKEVEESIISVEVEENWKDIIVNEREFTGVLDKISHLKGDELKVSDFLSHSDGTFEVNTSRFEKRNIAENLPCWNSENCISCNMCVMACPHGVIRPKILDEEELKNNSKVKAIDVPGGNYKFALEFSYDDCTGCSLCSSVCPGKKGNKAITMKENAKVERINNNVKATNKHLYPETVVKGLAFNKPLFKYSGACAGCGETPYIKMLTQIMGEGMIITNATGCSSIYGGSMPSSPYNVSWSNSLFEDNAEYGYGMGLTISIMKEKIEDIMKNNIDVVSEKNRELFNIWLDNKDDYKKTRYVMENINYNEVSDLEVIKDYIPSKSVWIIGGDGWSYDIGFGGLDHIMSTNENVNVLVLDTEVYSNTGGQSSKSTRKGAVAKFSSVGKDTSKKDLARMMMQYPNVYVAQISMGANMNQAIKAFNEAKNHNGPSLIIAYAPCINHGIKEGMGKSFSQEDLAVKSGYFPIFRYNAKEKTFNLDFKNPDFSLYGEFLANENRYKMISAVNIKHAKELLESNLEMSKERFEYYKSLD